MNLYEVQGREKALDSRCLSKVDKAAIKKRLERQFRPKWQSARFSPTATPF